MFLAVIRFSDHVVKTVEMAMKITLLQSAYVLMDSGEDEKERGRAWLQHNKLKTKFLMRHCDLGLAVLYSKTICWS